MLSDYSNYGVASVTLAAIGENLRCRVGDNAFTVLSGTSLATYYVAREIAIEISMNRKRSYKQVWTDFEERRLIENIQIKDKTITGKMPQINTFEVTYESCYIPSNIRISTMDNLAKLSWDSIISDVKYIIQYTKSGLQNWLTLETEDNFIDIFSLDLCTSYKIRIKSICDDLGESDFSETFTFYTDDMACNYVCLTPYNAIIINNSTIIEIEQSEHSDFEYLIEYAPYNATDWAYKYFFPQELPLGLTNVLPCSEHKYRLRVRCKNGIWSAPTPVEYFYNNNCKLDLNDEKIKDVLFTEISPNPTNGTINLMVLNKEPIDKEMVITLNDISGKILCKENLTAFGGTNKYTFSAQHLLQGLYFLKIESEKIVKTLKVIKK